MLRKFITLIMVVGVAQLAAGVSHAATKRVCSDECAAYDKDGKCTRTKKVCYEIVVEDPKIIDRDLTPPTQSCASADGKIYKCN